jgi:hypothetical protein
MGRAGSLTANKGDLARLIINWSGTEDSMAAARLGQLKQMVRDKAGHAVARNNLIVKTDILASLDVDDPDQLLPCKSALVPVGDIVKREQFQEALDLISRAVAPVLIQAAGGVGKTVFMTSLASALEDKSEVIFFDCFGGGAYRSPADARHLPKKGLIHIANTLAERQLLAGLCCLQARARELVHAK